MQDKPTDVLDHLVFVIEPGKLDEGVARFEKMGFKSIPGGFYNGGLASNALIVLADGVYIELMAYTHEASHYPPGSPERKARENHPWAKSAPGWADWTHLDFASDPSNTYKIINQRAGDADVYIAPMHAGRVRPDGVQLKWTVTFPKWAEQGVGHLPFFCQDLTSRTLRVPTDPASNTQHPNSAQGIASIKVFATAEYFEKQTDLLSAAVGSTPAKTNDTTAVWNLASPNPKSSTSPMLVLTVPPKDAAHAKGSGIAEVSLWFDTGAGGDGVREEILRLDG